MNHVGEISTLVRVAHLTSGVDQRGRGAPRILPSGMRHRRRQGGDPRRRHVRATARAQRRRRHGDPADSPLRSVVTFSVSIATPTFGRPPSSRGIDGIVPCHDAAGSVDLTTPLIGRANLANVLAATAVAVECGVRRGHRRSRPPPGSRLAARRSAGPRQRRDGYRRQLQRQSDCAMRAWRCSATPGSARDVVAVLGEMLELGHRALALHEDVGRAAPVAEGSMS